MFKDDKNIINFTYRDESWLDPKAMPGTECERFAHLKKVILAGIMKELDESGKIIVQEVESYFYKIYVTEYEASVAVLSVEEYKRLKLMEDDYKTLMKNSGQEE